MAKAASERMTDAEVRRCGERTGLDTLVVRTVNDAHLVCGQEAVRRSKRDKCAAWVKLKGIDGGPHKRWSMWFNSMVREEPYLGLTYTPIIWRQVSAAMRV